ncbi:hypothetical protein PENSPDRAFT_607459 [Peniophora sp. CONT]|nr:hypothetical protein PENSPDRAFT_607459 [Peniophora sp. CONT]
MQAPEPRTTTALLSRALHRLRTTAPRIIASPPTQPRRAAVALILRIVPPPNFPLPPAPSGDSKLSLPEFFAQDWVSHPNAQPEILFLHRENVASAPAADPNATSDAAVAFPGGRMEADDEDGLFTAMRHTWEEIGIDLAENDYMSIGQLDDREITTSLGKRLLMILSPFVFLQLSPYTRPVDPVPETTLHWVPLTALFPAPALVIAQPTPAPRWSSVSIDAASRLAPRHSTALRLLMRVLVGNMQFPALVLPPPPPFLTLDEKHAGGGALEAGAGRRQRPRKLWGLTLGMTLDLLSYTAPTPLTPWDADALMGVTGIEPLDGRGRRGRVDAPPSLTSVFPRFSYPDVNFWIWVFGKRYREVIRGWETSMRNGGVNDRRINWTGAALTTFYAAVRKALIVVLILRALGLLVGVALGVWWVLR